MQPEPVKRRARGWAIFAACACCLAIFFFVLTILEDRRLTETYDHASPGDQMLFTLGDWISGAISEVVGAAFLLIALCLVIVSVVKSRARSDSVSLCVTSVAAAATLLTLCILGLSAHDFHRAVARLYAATVARQKAMSEAEEDVNQALAYCHDYANQHNGGYPPDLAGIANRMRHFSSLRYYGVGMTSDLYETNVRNHMSASDLMDICVCIETGSGSGDWVVVGRLFGPVLPQTSYQWRTMVDLQNSTRTKLGLPLIKP